MRTCSQMFGLLSLESAVMGKFLLRGLCAMCVGLVLGLHAHGQERGLVPEFRTYGKAAAAIDATAVDALIEQYKTAWGRQDSAGFRGLHADDVEWINAYARILRGAEPLSQFLTTRLFPAFSPEVSAAEAANMRMISLRYLGEKGAVVHMYTEGRRGPSRNEHETLRRTHIHLVLEKQSTGWKIVHTAIMDAR